MAKTNHKKQCKRQIVTSIIQDVCDEMCDKYCKYPYEWDPEEHDGQELFDSEICANCPLNKLQ